MARVLVVCRRPQHLSASEADAWVRDEIARLPLPEGIERLELTRLCPAGSGHVAPGDWLCELYLRDGVDADGCVDHPVCAQWLCDLRLLGMRPTVAVTRSAELAR
ncbi:MAG: hypothetical protein M3295_00800 [Chloroflexota bacterium]|nr:hypothetical protein [Chloroflexota bacterium]